MLSFVFYMLFFIVSAVVIPVFSLFVFCCVPFLSHRKLMRLFRNLIKVYGFIVLRLPYPFVKIEYQDRSDTEYEPCIYVSNHRSSIDPFLMAFLPGEIIQVVNTWPFRLPVLGFMARCAGYLSVREMSPEDFLNKGEKLLDEGVSLAVFPEGTRSVSKKMGTFHSIVFRLALRCNVSLIPVCLSGAGKVMKKGSLKLSPGYIRVRKLSPVNHDKFRGMRSFRLKKYVHGIIAEELLQMEGGL